MARQVTVNEDNVHLPGQPAPHNTGDEVVLTAEEFAELDSSHIGTTVTDDGAVGEAGDEVVAQGTAVADLNQDISATYVEAEVQAISDKVDELLAALRGDGKPLASA